MRPHTVAIFTFHLDFEAFGSVYIQKASNCAGVEESGYWHHLLPFSNYATPQAIHTLRT